MDLPKLFCRNNCAMCVCITYLCGLGIHQIDAAENDRTTAMKWILFVGWNCQKCHIRILSWLGSNISGPMSSQWNVYLSIGGHRIFIKSCQSGDIFFFYRLTSSSRWKKKTNKSIEFHLKAISIASIIVFSIWNVHGIAVRDKNVMTYRCWLEETTTMHCKRKRETDSLGGRRWEKCLLFTPKIFGANCSQMHPFHSPNRIGIQWLKYWIPI